MSKYNESIEHSKTTGWWNTTLWPLVIFGATVVLNLIILATTSWVNNGYVSRTAFEAYVEKQRDESKKDAEKLNTDLREFSRQLQQIIDGAKNESAQDDRIKELDKSIKELERRK